MLREFFDDFPHYTTIREIILDGAERGGDKKQFVFEDKKGNVYEKTFREVYEDECNLGAYMRKIGITEKKKVAILSENSYEWNVCFYTSAVNGNIIVPMDSKLSSHEISHELIHCGCDAIFYSEACEEKLGHLKRKAENPIKWFLPIADLHAYIEEGKTLPEAYKSAYLSTEVLPDDLATIVYTSGTTGKTKGVMLSNRNIASNMVASNHANSGSHGIGFLPLNHTFSWVTGLFAGLIRSEWGFINTNILHIYKDIKKYKPQQFAGVPLVVEMIYKGIISEAKRKGTYEKLLDGIKTSRSFMLSGFDARREIFSEIHESLGGELEYIFCGGAYLDPAIEEFMHDIGIQIITGYGLTECSPSVTVSRRYDYKIGSVGLPLECNEIKINEPDDDGIGEIYVKGDNVMVGYYNDEQATKEVFDGEWLKTGDFGRIDEDGYLFFTGRKKNLIILSNGKNVSPEEIENKLYEIEYVKECIVFSENGKIIAEFYLDTEQYPHAEMLLSEDVQRINERLAEYKQIMEIRTRETEFPKTTTLKIIRKRECMTV